MREGAAMASGDRFEVNIEGKGGHGATPHLCADAIVMSAAIVQNLQTVVSREISPIETAVLTVGTIEGGTRWNVVSGSAKLTGTTRCFSNEVRAQFPVAMKRVVEETARAMRGKATLTYEELVPPTINDAKLARAVRASAQKVLGDDYFFDYPITMGGEDFAYYQQKVPGVIALLGVGNPECDAVHAQHSGCYKVDENALIYGAMTHVQVAYDFLNN